MIPDDKASEGIIIEAVQYGYGLDRISVHSGEHWCYIGNGCLIKKHPGDGSEWHDMVSFGMRNM